jgi:uncharacterized membrane protein YhaH (DUF805 family)
MPPLASSWIAVLTERCIHRVHLEGSFVFTFGTPGTEENMGIFRLKIGRVVYFLLMVACVFAGSALNTQMAIHHSLQHIFGVPLLVHGIDFLILAIFAVIVMPARLRDAGLTSWLALLLLIPFLDIGLVVLLMFVTEKGVAKWRSRKPQKEEV